MSRMPPRMQRTSLASCDGGHWKCIPRTVPRERLWEMLDWMNSPRSPCAANSFTQMMRAKKPRSSTAFSGRTSHAPSRASGSNRMSAPVQLGIDLLAVLQILQLLQPREGPVLVDLIRELNALE